MTTPRILVLMDRHIDAPHDTSVAIIEEALSRGLIVDACDTDDLQFTPAGAAAEARRVGAAGAAGMVLDEPIRTPLARYAAILFRKDPPFTIDTLYATLLLEHARGHALLVNDPRGLREANEKLLALRFPAFTPPTAVLRDPPAIHAFCRAQDGRCVIKPLDGCGGSGIFLLREEDPNANAIVETATREGRRPVIAQAWLPVAEHGDKRIFLLDGEPLGAILRVPSSGESRANLHRGGTPHATTLTPRERHIARTVGVACRELGLALVGLDVIAGHLTEINVTSPTGFREIEQLTSMRPQEHFLNWLTARLPVSSGALAPAA